MPTRNNLPAELPELPDFSANPEEILSRLISQYESAYLEQNGSSITLSSGDKIRIWIYTIALNQYLLENLVTYYASQNYITYAKGNFLDNISATRGGPQRKGASAAVVTIKFIFSTPLTQVEIIPTGTRVTANGSNIFFATTEQYTLPIGSTEWEHVFTCQTLGVAGNNFLSGQIDTLADPLPYVQRIFNLDTSQGGAEIEDDSHYAERIFLSPEGYAVAGPELAYEYIAKSYNTAIEDVKAYRSAPGEVTIVPLLQGGEIPEPAFLSGLLDFMSAKDKRPLTDYVQTVAPTIFNFDINFTYYISSDNSAQQQAIQDAVEKAVNDYIAWQKGRMGRDINSQELITLVRSAGAKRLDIVSPVYTEIDPYGIAIANDPPTIFYGGLEDE